MGLADIFGGPAVTFTRFAEDELKKAERKAATEEADKKLSAEETALEAEKAALRGTLEKALTGQTRGLQAAQAGRTSNLLAQLQRLGIRGASQARQLRAQQSQQAQQLAASRFAGQTKIEQLIENLRNSRISEIAAKDALRRRAIEAANANRPFAENVARGEQLIGGILGSIGSAAGTAFGGPIGGALGGAASNFVSGLFSPRTDPSLSSLDPGLPDDLSLF